MLLITRFVAGFGVGLVVGLVAFRGEAFGPSLDEMYRNTLREENDGVLPPFVLNRGLPPVPERKPISPETPVLEESGRNAAKEGGPLLSSPLSWADAVKEVAEGRPSPFAVEEVKRRADQDDPQAIELLAWMYAQGVGVARSLPKAFLLYVRAEALGVDKARDNAQAIYKAMPPSERRTTSNPFG